MPAERRGRRGAGGHEADPTLPTTSTCQCRGNYFRWGNSTRQFTQVDSYVRERLALHDSKKRGRQGRRWGQVHTYTWFKGVGMHFLSGTIRYGTLATAAP